MASKLPIKSSAKRQKSASSGPRGARIREIMSSFTPEECATRLAAFPSTRFTILRYADLAALRDEGFAFPELFAYQGVTKFLGMKDDYYPELVREFYANFMWDAQYEEHVSFVNGQLIELTPDVFKTVADLKFKGSYVGDCANPAWKDCQWPMYYQSCLRHPSLFHEGEKPKAGDMTVEDRLILYLITYCLSPKTSSNHSTPSHHELSLVYAVKNRLKIDWPREIIQQISLRATSSRPQLLAYPVLISRILDYYGVNVDRAQKVSLRRGDALNKNIFHSMHIYQHHETGVWEWQDNKRIGEDVGEPSDQPPPDQPMDEAVAPEPSAPLSSDERFDLINTRLTSIDGRLDVIDGRYASLDGRLLAIQSNQTRFASHVDAQFLAMSNNISSGFDLMTRQFQQLMQAGPSYMPPPPPHDSQED